MLQQSISPIFNTIAIFFPWQKQATELKSFKQINLPPFMPDEDNSLILMAL